MWLEILTKNASDLFARVGGNWAFARDGFSAFFVSDEFASISTNSDVAFLGGNALGVVWSGDTSSRVNIAGINGAINSVVTFLLDVNASEILVTSVDGAEVVVVTSLWNVDASKFQVANVEGASVLVFAEVSVVPAFGSSAFEVLTFEAIIISLTLLPVLVFAEVVAVGVGALEDLVFEAFSGGLSAVFCCLGDAFVWSDVDSTSVLLCTKRKLVLAALLCCLALEVVAEKDRSCLAAFGTSDESDTLFDLLLDANFTDSLDALALLFLAELSAFLLDVQVALDAILVFTTSLEASSEGVSVAVSGLDESACRVSIS